MCQLSSDKGFFDRHFLFRVLSNEYFVNLNQSRGETDFGIYLYSSQNAARPLSLKCARTDTIELRFRMADDNKYQNVRFWKTALLEKRVTGERGREIPRHAPPRTKTLARPFARPSGRIGRSRLHDRFRVRVGHRNDAISNRTTDGPLKKNLLNNPTRRKQTPSITCDVFLLGPVLQYFETVQNGAIISRRTTLSRVKHKLN